MTSPVRVVGAAIVDSGLILAARRGPQMSLPGMWEFPGGKIESGETAEAALVRELEEELQVRTQVGEFVARGESALSDGRSLWLDVYVCTIVDGQVDPVEHDAIKWLAPKELKDIEWAVPDWPAVERLSSDPSLLEHQG